LKDAVIQSLFADYKCIRAVHARQDIPEKYLLDQHSLINGMEYYPFRGLSEEQKIELGLNEFTRQQEFSRKYHGHKIPEKYWTYFHSSEDMDKFLLKEGYSEEQILKLYLKGELLDVLMYENDDWYFRMVED